MDSSPGDALDALLPAPLRRAGLQASCRRPLGTLPELPRSVLAGLYLHGRTPQQVAAELGLAPVAVGEIEAAALRALAAARSAEAVVTEPAGSAARAAAAYGTANAPDAAGALRSA